MKTSTANMRSHLDQECTTLAALWRVTRVDGVELFFTNHDKDLTYPASGGDLYKAQTGFSRTAVSLSSDLNPNNMNLQSVFDPADVDEADLRAGLYDYAEVRLLIVNWTDLSASMGDVKVLRGRLGEVSQSENFYTAELRDLLQQMSQKVGESYSAECRADLGDSRCTVPIEPDEVQRSTAYSVGDHVRVATAAGDGVEVYEDRIYECTTAGTTAGSEPTYDTIVGNTTADGTVVFTAREAWIRAVQVIEVVDRKTFKVAELTPNSSYPDNYFDYGGVKWDTGDNTGTVQEVKVFTADDGVTIEQQIELFIAPPFEVSVGDKAGVYPGCDKRLSTCKAKFDNVVNFRGEPHLPGRDFITDYPNAKEQ